MRSKVVFTAERSVPEELDKVKRFLHLFEYFALTWDVDIQVDAPHGKPLPAENNEGVLQIHFFSYPEEANKPARHLVCVEKLYGFPVPIDELEKDDNFAVWHGGGCGDEGGYYAPSNEPVIISSNNDVGAKFSSAEFHPALKTVRSFDGGIVAEILPGHIYILFDMAHREWDGDECVLLLMLSEAFPMLFGEKKDCLLELSGRELYLANRLHLKIAARIPQFKKGIRALCLQHLSKELKDTSKKRKDEGDSCDNLSLEYLQLCFQIDSVLERLANPKDVLTDEYLTREFNKIIQMKAVKGVRLEGNQIRVYTNPLTMENHNSQIGEYEIIVDLTALYIEQSANKWVRIKECGKRGEYHHVGVHHNEAVPCWGSVVSPALAKVFADCDIPSIIHLALVFLIFDTRLPVTRASEAYSDIYSKENQPEESEKPFYPDEEALNRACRDYAVLIRRFKEANLNDSLDKRRKELGKEQARLLRQMVAARKQLQELQYVEGFILESMKQLDPESELDMLFNEESLVGLGMGKNWLYAIFAPQQGYGNLESMILPSLTIFLDVSSGQVSVFSRRETQLFQRKEVSFSEEEKEIFGKLIYFGKLGTAILAIRNLACGKKEAFQGGGRENVKKEIDTNQ